MTAVRDVVVIGAGPAGLAAGTLLQTQGADVVVLDENAAPGGQIYRGVESMTVYQPELFDQLGADYARGDEMVAKFRISGLEYLAGSLVWQITPGAPHDIWARRQGRVERIRARMLVLATGAMERPVAVPGWTLPGAMGAGAVQTLLKSAALVLEDMVLAGSGPLLYLLALQCINAGARPAAILDTSSRANLAAALPLLPRALRGAGLEYFRKGLALKWQLRRSGVPLFREVTDIALQGESEVTDIAFRSRGRPQWLTTGLVALHEGVIPAQQITRMLGMEHDWDGQQHCFRPRLDSWGNSSVPNVLVAGDAGGIGGARVAEHAGRITAAEVLRRLGRIDGRARDGLSAADRVGRTAHLAFRPFLDRLYPPPAAITLPKDDVTVCRCEEVTAGQLRAAARRGCQGPNQAKSFLRAGMGPCQGRMCGLLVSTILADAHARSVPDIGYLRVRSPLKPITVGELAGLDLDEADQPEARQPITY